MPIRACASLRALQVKYQNPGHYSRSRHSGDEPTQLEESRHPPVVCPWLRLPPKTAQPDPSPHLAVGPTKIEAKSHVEELQVSFGLSSRSIPAGVHNTPDDR